MYGLKAQRSIITQTVGCCCMVEYVFHGLGEIRIAQELRCSNQLKGEWYIADIRVFFSNHSLFRKCYYMTDPARNGTV